MANTEIHNITFPEIVFDYRALSVAKGVVTLGGVYDTQGFEAVEFRMAAGILSAGVGAIWRLVLKDSDISSNFQPVGLDSIIGDSLDIATSNSEVSVGYLGKKRFVEVSIELEGIAFAAVVDSIGVTAIGGAAHHIPVQE